jgi:hypothetical protein
MAAARIGMVLSDEPSIGMLNFAQRCAWLKTENMKRASDTHQTLPLSSQRGDGSFAPPPLPLGFVDSYNARRIRNYAPLAGDKAATGTAVLAASSRAVSD